MIQVKQKPLNITLVFHTDNAMFWADWDEAMAQVFEQARDCLEWTREQVAEDAEDASDEWSAGTHIVGPDDRAIGTLTIEPRGKHDRKK